MTQHSTGVWTEWMNEQMNEYIQVEQQGVKQNK